MAHSVSCGVCNATFSIPDDVWEKRVEGQLATLKCRQCKAPIQIDGRTKRNAHSLVESRAVIEPKPTAASASTASNQDVSPAAANATHTSEGRSGKVAAEKPNLVTAVTPALTDASREQPQTKAGPVERVKSEPGVTAPRLKSSTNLTASHETTHDKTGGIAAVRSGNAHPGIAAKKAEEHLSKKEEQPRSPAASSESKPRTDDPVRQSSAKLTEIAPDKQPTVLPSTKKAAQPTKLPTTGHSAPTAKSNQATAAKPTSAVAAATPGEQRHALTPQVDAAASHQDSNEGQHQATSNATLASTDQPINAPTTANATAASRGGGPPPLRKAAASAPELSGGAVHTKPKGLESSGTEKHRPPPLPRQASVHDAEVNHAQAVSESHDNALRVHSPASMPVVAAMAVPFAGSRTPSLSPRPSDIAALVKIRPKFPKWLPFAVLAAAVLLVAGLAGLSWLRGDVSIDKPVSSGNNSTVPYPEGSASIGAKTSSPALPATNASASDSRSNAAEFASQFAQAAAKHRVERFDRELAEKALAPAFAKAASCHNRGDPIGAARVTISIAPSGQILSVTVTAPFAGTYTAECIRNALAEARSEPFQGAPGRLVHSISIR